MIAAMMPSLMVFLCMFILDMSQDDETLPNFIKRKHPKKGEGKKQGASKVQDKIHCLLDKVLNLMVWPQSQVKLTRSRYHVHCWHSNLSVEINYPTTLPASIVIILFSEMLSFSHKIFLKKKLWREKILKLQEYFVCWNENFKKWLL